LSIVNHAETLLYSSDELNQHYLSL